MTTTWSAAYGACSLTDISVVAIVTETRMSPQPPGAHLPDHPDFLWRNPEPKRSYDVVIVGGGGHGLATAHYLVKNHGITNVAVLEKGWPAATWLATRR